MNAWSLPEVLKSLHEEIEHRLGSARKTFSHPGTKGDASESIWLDLLTTYLPQRYKAERAHVVDSAGAFSEQIDVVVFDRQYSPFIFYFAEQTIVPAESVYAVFETKQAITAAQVRYAQKKVTSVRQLHRTSLPIPHAGGIYDAKGLQPILGGILTFDSEWTPPLGEPLLEALQRGEPEGRLDIGCIAAHGVFGRDSTGRYSVTDAGGKPATAFLFELISRLQSCATVPMIDINAYARWLKD
jgi:hypothetical protein